MRLRSRIGIGVFPEVIGAGSDFGACRRARGLSQRSVAERGRHVDAELNRDSRRVVRIADAGRGGTRPFVAISAGPDGRAVGRNFNRRWVGMTAGEGRLQIVAPIEGSGAESFTAVLAEAD